MALDPPTRLQDLSVDQRVAWCVRTGLIDPAAGRQLLAAGGLTPARADRMLENVIGTFALPLGLAVNLVVNDREYVVPMAVEEPSIVAAQSNAAKLVAAAGGFRSRVSDPVMAAQVQLVGVADPHHAARAILAAEPELAELARAHHPRLSERGGGWRGVEARVVEHPDGEQFVVVHLLLDVRDAMGANMLNSLAEAISGPLADIAGGRAGLRILSNLADRRRVLTTCRIPVDHLGWRDFSAEEVAGGIVGASRFAEADPYRAATHNKGVLNGVDALLVATGNDWRAVEAAAHAWAARDGRYGPLSTFRRDADGALVGRLEMPMPLATVGGATGFHPLAAELLRRTLKVETASELSAVAGAVGLAQNLAALKALATEGIQRGHMRHQARRRLLDE